MKVTLRTILILSLIALLALSIFIVGLTSYITTSRDVHELSFHILRQAAFRMESWINGFLNPAWDQNSLNLRLIRSGNLRPNNFPLMATYWKEVMEVHPEFSHIAIALEKTGEYFQVARDHDGRLFFRELRRNPQIGNLELRDYWPHDFPKTPHFSDTNLGEKDPRKSLWYQWGRKKQEQAWTETFTFLGEREKFTKPGIACVAPILDDNKQLVGVITVAYDLLSLSRYLQTIEGRSTALGFIVEVRADNSRWVIAHPDPKTFLRTDHQDTGVCSLVPSKDIPDQRVQGFLRCIPSASKLLDSPQVFPIRFEEKNISYIGGYYHIQLKETPNWLLCLVAPRDAILENVIRNNRITLVIGLISLVVAIILSILISIRISRPLKELARETERIGKFKLDPKPLKKNIVLEVDRLTEAVEEMKSNLRSFQKFVPAELVRQIVASGQEAVLGGERKTLSVFFSDIANFTTIAETLKPEDVVDLLSEYHGAMSKIIQAHNGTLDKYIGDAIMAFWGAPISNPRHALDACSAAIRCQQKLDELRQGWQAQKQPPFFTRIGINTGNLVVGNLGSSTRLDYTVIGDTVNLASRLEGLNKHYQTQNLISDHTYQEVKEYFRTRRVDKVSVKGKTEGVWIYELIGFLNETKERDVQWIKPYEAGLNAYCARDWTTAVRHFEDVLRIHPQDKPALVMFSRAQHYMQFPPPSAWDGVFHMEEK